MRRAAARKKGRKRQASDALKRKRRGDVIATLRRYYTPALACRMTDHQDQIIHQLLGCRTGRFGSCSHYCRRCDHSRITLNSCGNRHCTRCGDGRRSAWRERMAVIALPVSYLHNVFTTPHELNAVHDLSEDNVKAMIGLLFDSVVGTIKRVLKQKFGIGTVAAVMTLHSWGQRMLRHVHVHVVLIAGGISIDGERWIQLDLDERAMEELRQELAREFRRTYLRRFRGRVAKGKIRMTGDGRLRTADALVEKLERKHWMVDLKSSPKKWEGGSEGIINYLSAYVSGAAISDFRIAEDDGTHVTISYKDYRLGGKKRTEKMRGEEFVLRFVSHFLPPHCRRIRYTGLYTPQGREENLKTARTLIAELHGGKLPEVTRRSSASIDSGDPEQTEARRELFTGKGNERTTFPVMCDRCQQYMEPSASMSGDTTLLLLPYLIAVMEWLVGKLPEPPQERPEFVPLSIVMLIHNEKQAIKKRSQRHCKPVASIRGSP